MYMRPHKVLMHSLNITPRHEEVQRYLRAFAIWYGLHRVVRFNTQVLHAEPLPATLLHPEQPSRQQEQLQHQGSSQHGAHVSGGPPPRWRLRLQPTQDGGSTEDLDFDALVVANGHYR